MKFLTSLSALIMAAAGAFCFAYYMNGYAGVAFALGAALMLYGFIHLLCYIIGFRKSRLPEAVFVDGCVSMALGFLAIADLIPEGSISTYFGLWFMFSGVCRFAEALAVSKVNPKHWFGVVPLAIISALMGFIMVIPSMLIDFEDLYVIAWAYIINALSVAVYAINMLPKKETQKSKEAKARAEAKKKAAEIKRQERDRQRKLSEAEREAELEAARQEKVKLAEEKAALRAERKESRRPASERTIGFTPEETAEINAAAEAAEVIENSGAVKIIEEEPEELTVRPVFNKPENIPTFEKSTVVEEKPVGTEDLGLERKRGIVNLEEMENKTPDVKFETPELSQPTLLASGGEARHRDDILLSLEEEKPRTEDVDDLSGFTPLTLEELFADEQYNIKPLSDSKSAETDLKLTQTFTFDWLDTKL